MSTTSSEAKMNEAEFLDTQAAEAQAAIEETWTDIKQTLRETASLEVWTQRHPWLVTGAALAGGFLLATAILSPGRETSPENAEPDEEPVRSPPQPRRRGISRLMAPLFHLMRPILGQLVTSLIGSLVAGLTAGMAASADSHGAATNGDTGTDREGPVPV